MRSAMSLGRLLRRASSKASDLLTLTTGGSGGSLSVLDGEVIYSKNNVCVHAPEGLQGPGEHHPGYLCLYMEKDELLGATLILAWVPNSRIQRQDEEALRYITPEGSPVRKAPRPRRRRTTSLGATYQPSPTEPRPPLIPKDEDILVVVQNTQDSVHISPTDEDGVKLAQGPEVDGPLPTSQPVHSDSGILSTVSSQDGTENGREPRPEAVEEEGSLELSADGVSRDSSFDSDSDAFSSPFCLSPISAALAEGNSSAFLESEGSSPSSSDANLRFPDSNGLLQTPRWDEPQRGCALEQICGVFRVDLGHMRSLRLFFSDEACTSGQLVVASRESQYKIFHFHHGGLDKLSEVFQQWKFCTETHLRDQVAWPTVGRDMVGYGQGNGSSSLRMPNTWVWDHSSTPSSRLPGPGDFPLRSMAFVCLWFGVVGMGVLGGWDLFPGLSESHLEHLKTPVFPRLSAIFCSICIQRQ